MGYIFKRYTLTIISLVLFTTLVGVQPSLAGTEQGEMLSLSLEEAISLAFDNDKNILAQAEEVKAAEAEILSAAGGFLPRVNVEGGYIHRDAVMGLKSSLADDLDKDLGVFVGYEDEKRVGLSVEQSIFEGGKNIANLKRAKLKLKVEEEVLRLQKNKVEFEVWRLYYGGLLADETERIAQELLDQAQSHYEIVKEKFEQGASSRFDLLQSKVQVSKVIPELIRAQNAKELIVAEFKKLVGIERKDSVTLEGELTCSFFAVNDRTYEKFLEIAYNKRPELAIKELEIGVGQESISVAKARGRPQVNATFNYDYRSDDTTDMFNSRHNNWNVGVSVSIPLFDGFSAKTKVDQAKARYRQAELGKEDARDTVALQVKQGVLDLSQARAIIESQQSSLREAEEFVEIAEARYDNGVGTNLDVLDAQVSLSQIKKNLSQGIYDYLVAKAYLNKTVGTNLFTRRIEDEE